METLSYCQLMQRCGELESRLVAVTEQVRLLTEQRDAAIAALRAEAKFEALEALADMATIANNGSGIDLTPNEIREFSRQLRESKWEVSNG